MSLPNQVILNQVKKNGLQTDENTFRVLQQTLYPGSTDQEVAMILSYCKARKIDPILKPVHLVPMNVKTDKKGEDGKFIYDRKNVIMPGIGLYRIDASRSGQYAGISEPEFGEEITKEFGDKYKKKVTFPKWCKMTVKKIMPDGNIAEFTAMEFWLENYASKSNFDDTPNTMWEKRAYGQLAKCTEAQALRKAFPDIVGNEYTKEEMEGKLFPEEQTAPKIYVNENKDFVDHKLFEGFKASIEKADTEDQLKLIFDDIKKSTIRLNKELFVQLVDAKDKRKGEIIVKDFNKELNADTETGEVLS